MKSVIFCKKCFHLSMFSIRQSTNNKINNKPSTNVCFRKINTPTEVHSCVSGPTGPPLSPHLRPLVYGSVAYYRSVSVCSVPTVCGAKLRFLLLLGVRFRTLTDRVCRQTVQWHAEFLIRTTESSGQIINK